MLKPGDVLIRFLPQYQVWHWGLVVGARAQTLDDIMVFEFADSDAISLVRLRDFCWFRKYFWVYTFAEERRRYGNRVFNDTATILRIAKELSESKVLKYNIARQNCEYFVRRCIFNDPNLWESKQTEVMGNSMYIFVAKMLSIVIASTIFKFGEMKEFEKDFLPEHIRYETVGSDLLRKSSPASSALGEFQL
jgi:hypothetical protein